MHRIYLASPYSHPFFLVRWWRWLQACRATHMLIKQGFHVYSPIVNGHWLCVLGRLPWSWNHWQRIDQREIVVSQQLWVLRLKGWNKSKGVRAEMDLARTLGIPVRMVRPGQVYKTVKASKEQAA